MLGTPPEYTCHVSMPMILALSLLPAHTPPVHCAPTQTNRAAWRLLKVQPMFKRPVLSAGRNTCIRERHHTARQTFAIGALSPGSACAAPNTRLGNPLSPDMRRLIVAWSSPTLAVRCKRASSGYAPKLCPEGEGTLGTATPREGNSGGKHSARIHGISCMCVACPAGMLPWFRLAHC